MKILYILHKCKQVQRQPKKRCNMKVYANHNMHCNEEGKTTNLQCFNPNFGTTQQQEKKGKKKSNNNIN